MHVFLIAAVTNDGFIAKSQDQKSTRWTSAEDFEFFTQRTKQAGVVVMGSTTFRTIGHPLKDRLTIVMTNHPERNKSNDDLIYSNQSPQEIIHSVSDKNYSELAICGGSSIYTQFMDNHLVDTIYLTVHTQVSFGQGIPLFSHPIDLGQPIKTTPLSPTTILEEYQLKNNKTQTHNSITNKK